VLRDGAVIAGAASGSVSAQSGFGEWHVEREGYEQAEPRGEKAEAG
jgi:hypothetical protein